MSLSSSPFKRFALLAAALAPVALITGCSMETTAIQPVQSLAAISGRTMGARAPISSAAVTLYDAGKLGYGSTPTVLGTATSDGSGSFSITRNLNTCVDPDQLYLVSSGGNPGAGTNTAAVLVEALGTCSTITTATSGLVINELTTVAAAYALAGFATVDGSSVAIGTSATNSLGLQHAFANAANLVAYNGVPLSTTSGGNGTVPVTVLNTLADGIAACVNSTGSASPGCANIFVAAPAGTTTGLPGNTWQAALNMALYPGNNVANVFTNAGASPYFQPTLSTQPTDLSVGIAYYTGFKADGVTKTGFPWDIKADASGNIWISGQTGAGLVELSPTGTVLSPPGGWGSTALQAAFTHGIAFDNLPSPNVWLGDTAGNVYSYNPASNTTTAIALPTSITVATVATTVAKAAAPVSVDSLNNVWYATEAGTATATQTLGEIPVGTFTPLTVFVASPLFPETTKGAYSMTVDAKTNTIWAGSQSTNNVYNWQAPYTSSVATTAAANNPINTIAQDGSGNTWAVAQGSGANKGVLYKFSSTSPSTLPTAVAAPTGATTGLYNPRGLAIDGVGRLFVISYTGSTSATPPTYPSVVEYDPTITTGSSTPSGYLLNPNSNGFTPVDNTGTPIFVGSGPRNATIDAAGALWISNGTAIGQPGAVQVFGIAAPSVTPLSKGQYGARP